MPARLILLWVILFLTYFLTGCATCQRHETACVVGGAVLAGVVAIAVAHNYDSSHQPVYCPGPNCPIPRNKEAP